MSDSVMHEVDPDGDTLLILRHSDAPFAVCDTDELWPNALPRHQSAKSKEQEISILSREPADGGDGGDGGDGVLSGISSPEEDKPELKHTRYKLCSHILRRTCSYFARLMSSKWQEAESEKGYQWTIKATDWDDEAVTLLMNILHHRTRLIPRKLSLEMLTKIAVLVDYYGCLEAVELWAEIWMAELGSVASEHYSRGLLLRLTVAMVFSDKKSFSTLTKYAIRSSRGPIHTLGLPIPQQIVDAVEEKRKKAISQFLQDLQSIWDGLNVDRHNKLLQCQWMLLGYIDQNLFLQGLKPLPNPPFSGFSVNGLVSAFSCFHSGKGCPCTAEDHINELRARVLSCVRKAWNSCEDGLRMQQGLVKETTQDTTRSECSLWLD